MFLESKKMLVKDKILFVISKIQFTILTSNIQTFFQKSSTIGQTKNEYSYTAHLYILQSWTVTYFQLKSQTPLALRANAVYKFTCSRGANLLTLVLHLDIWVRGLRSIWMKQNQIEVQSRII